MAASNSPRESIRTARHRWTLVIAAILILAASLFAELSPGRAATTEYPAARITAVNRASTAQFDFFMALRARLVSPFDTHHVGTAAIHTAIAPLFCAPVRRFVTEPPLRLSTRPAPGLPLLVVLQRSCIWHQSTDSDPASQI